MKVGVADIVDAVGWATGGISVRKKQAVEVLVFLTWLKVPGN